MAAWYLRLKDRNLIVDVPPTHLQPYSSSLNSISISSLLSLSEFKLVSFSCLVYLSCYPGPFWLSVGPGFPRCPCPAPWWL